MNIFLDTFDEYGWVGIAGLFMCMIIFILLRKFGNQLKIEVNDGLSDIGKELTSQMKLQNEELIHTIMDQQKMLIDHIVKKDKQEELNHQYMLNERMFNAEDINKMLGITISTSDMEKELNRLILDSFISKIEIEKL